MTGMVLLGTFLATSFSAIGVAVGIGVAGSLGSIIAGVAVSAVVGAAIGGISAAVTGGDIGKGMLFGAIGGVVTGGIAGGSLANAGVSAGTAGGEGALGWGGTSLASQVTTSSVTTAGANLGGQAVGASSMFGGAFSNQIGNTATNQIGSKLVDAGLGLLTPEPEGTQEDFGKTKEGFYAALKSAEDQQRIANEGRTEPQHNWGITEEGIRYRGGQDMALHKEDNASRLRSIDKEYTLQRQNADAAYVQANKKYGEAADITSKQEFVTDPNARKAVIAAEAGRQPGPEEAPQAALAGR